MTVPFDFFVLAAVAAVGGRRLLLSVDPHAARVHFTQVKRDNPTQPPGFCQIARKYLEGAWVEAVEFPYPDRILHLVCRSVDGEHVALICELMGRNSNLVLVSRTNTVHGVCGGARAGQRAGTS